METTTIIIIVAVLLVILIGMWYIKVLNKLNIALVKIDETASGIDVALTKRYDLLTKMVEVVKGYTKHEKETITEVTKLRKNMSMNDKNKMNNEMTQAIEQIKIIAENYPDLKANENFIVLQNSISEVEENLQVARKLYNSNVSTFNQLIVVFPNSIVATTRRMKQKEFFEADDLQKEDVKINF